MPDRRALYPSNQEALDQYSNVPDEGLTINEYPDRIIIRERSRSGKTSSTVTHITGVIDENDPSGGLTGEALERFNRSNYY